MKQSKSTTRKTLKIYIRESLNHKALYFGANLCWIAGMLLQKLMLPLIVAKTFDQIVSSKSPASLHWSMFTHNLVAFILVAAIAQVLIDYSLVLLSKLETKVIKKLHTRIYEFLINQSIHFHNNSFGGALVNQTNRFVTGYVSITDTIMINVSQLVVLIFFSSLVLFFYSPILGLTIVTWSLVFIYINIKLTRRRIPLSKARASADSILTGYLADSIGNASSIKTYSAESYELSKYKKLAKDRAEKGYVYWMRTVKNDVYFGSLMCLLQILVLVVSISGIKHGTISIGTLVLAQVYITQAIAYLWGLSNISKSVEQSLSDAAEMTEILGQESSLRDQSDARPLQIKNGDIEFEHVSFTHIENEEILFDDLSFGVKSGEKIGLVGPSGGGKTTVTKLLLRFMDIQDGKILVDHQDITKVTQRSLRESIAYVPQEPLLFHRTLSENISHQGINGTVGGSIDGLKAYKKSMNLHSKFRLL